MNALIIAAIPLAQEAVKTASGESIAAGMWTLVGVVVTAICGVATVYIKQWGPWQRGANADRATLKKMADDREDTLLEERAADMRGMRRRIAELEAEQRIDRHTVANLEQCLDTLLTMIEFSPERAKEAAVKVAGMRAEMKLQQAAEKGGLHSASIAATEVEP